MNTAPVNYMNSSFEQDRMISRYFFSISQQSLDYICQDFNSENVLIGAINGKQFNLHLTESASTDFTTTSDRLYEGTLHINVPQLGQSKLDFKNYFDRLHANIEGAILDSEDIKITDKHDFFHGYVTLNLR